MQLLPTFRKRHGLSDLVATVLLVAMTLIAGAALFGYVNGQAANSENGLANANAANVNFLNERFVVVDMAVPVGGTSANLWIYNNGNLTLNISQIIIYEGTKSNLYVVYTGKAPTSGCGSASSPSFGSAGSFVFGSGGTQIKSQSNPIQVTLTLPSGCGGFSSQTTYYANVLGLYGNDVVFSACDSTTECTK